MNRTTITTLALAIAGGSLWSFSGNKLADDRGFEYQPNPLGIKRSPYGQVLAMAIQVPIDADWHGGLEIHDHPHGEHDHGHDHHGHGEHDHPHGEHDHDHHDESELATHDDHEEETRTEIASGALADKNDDDCDGCDDRPSEEVEAIADNEEASPAERPAPAEGVALLSRLQNAVSQRTNPNPPTAGHQLYLRQEIEKKLRFAYELDPSHYANYNCYHLFVTQRELGTHGLPEEEVTKMVEQLTDYTIRYCLTEQEDPRPALTAASAAYNVLERMVTSKVYDSEKGDLVKMREQLGTMDLCIQRHFTLLEEFVEDGSFAGLSAQRQQEILTRSRFTVKLREAAQDTILRLESETSTADPS